MQPLKIKTVTLLFLLFLLILPSAHRAYGQEDRDLYRRANQAACKGEDDFAFVYFYRLLNYFPDSEYRQQALFATGEYYYSIGDYRDAAVAFERSISNFPESEAKIFAIAYLLKIAKIKGDQKKAEKLKQGLISLEQVSLLFREFEELKYTSPFCKDYKILNFIDKIEIYVGDELFDKISF